MKSNNKWFLFSKEQPNLREVVEIMDDVGKKGRAIYDKKWLIQDGMNIKDFSEIIKWRVL